MSTVSSASETIEQPTRERRKRGCLFYIRRAVMWFGIVICCAGGVGGGLPGGRR